MGIPLSGLPMNGEQPINAEQVLNELMIVRWVDHQGGQSFASNKGQFALGLMSWWKERMVREVQENAQEIRREASWAVEQDRPSYKSAIELINKLRTIQK